jgi:hypothetical protein
MAAITSICITNNLTLMNQICPELHGSKYFPYIPIRYAQIHGSNVLHGSKDTHFTYVYVRFLLGNQKLNSCFNIIQLLTSKANWTLFRDSKANWTFRD